MQGRPRPESPSEQGESTLEKREGHGSKQGVRAQAGEMVSCSRVTWHRP